jgi:SM-20-related protein
MNARAEYITIISEHLTRVGWEERHGLFDPALLRALANEAHLHEQQGHTQRGSTGRMAGRQPTDVRGDSTLWLDDPRCGAAAAAFLEALHVLRRELNESLLMGLATVDAHFAVYPAGAA